MGAPTAPVCRGRERRGVLSSARVLAIFGSSLASCFPGFVPVMLPGSFDLPHHDGEEEADDAVPVVGLVADYIGEGAVVLEDDELLRGVDAVVDPGIFELSLHGGEKETDDEPSALGLLATMSAREGTAAGGASAVWAAGNISSLIAGLSRGRCLNCDSFDGRDGDDGVADCLMGHGYAPRRGWIPAFGDSCIPGAFRRKPESRPRLNIEASLRILAFHPHPNPLPSRERG